MIQQKWHVYPTRSENRSERLYRLTEEIDECRQAVKAATKAGDFVGVQRNLKRIETLTAQRDS